MSKAFPEFEDEQAMVEWFETANLDAYDLSQALEVVVSTKVGLTLAEPWALVTGASSASAGATGVIVADIAPVTS